MSERDELIECLRVCGACHGCGIGADGDTCTNCGDERQLNRLAASLLERDGAELARLRAEVARLTAENDWLRAYTGQSAKACIYCGLGADEQGECNRGFPGCARADDQMLCREVEVAMERDELLARVEAAERDAGRYRWLRNESLHWLIRAPICIDADTWGEPVMACGKHVTLDGATLDAAIDAAMEGGK